MSPSFCAVHIAGFVQKEREAYASCQSACFDIDQQGGGGALSEGLGLRFFVPSSLLSLYNADAEITPGFSMSHHPKQKGRGKGRTVAGPFFLSLSDALTCSALPMRG